MPTTQSIPRSQRAERADRVSEATWEEHRETIKKLYIDEKMRLEDLISHMEEEHGFSASEQQYKIQFNKWGMRKNKRRMDQRASSPEPDEERLTQRHANTRFVESAPSYVNPVGDPNGIIGAAGTPNLGFYTNPLGGMGMQTFVPDPFPQPAMSLSNQFMPPYAGQYASPYVQTPTTSIYGQAQPMYGQIQQFNAPPTAQTAHIQVSNYNVLEGSNGTSSLPARQMSRSLSAVATGTKPSRHPIHQSVQSGSFRGTKLLIDANSDCAHALDDDNIGPAWIAAQGGHVDILKLLIKHKVDVNVPERENQRYPLHQAAQSGHKTAVELLLQNGAHPDPVDKHGITPLWLSAQSGYHEIVTMILDQRSAENPVDIEVVWESKERRAIHQAAQGGHLKTVQLLLENGADYDPVDASGITPLWSAAQNGHADLAREFLKAGAKVDVAPYENSRQPIHQAAQSGHVDVVRVLLDYGANLTPEADSFDDSEDSPFLLACMTDKPELISLFLDRGVDPKMTFHNQKGGALHFAAHGGHVAVGQLLVDQGCDVDAREADGWTPLILAAQDGHLDFVNLLISNHANIHAEEKDGATALWIAAQQGHASIVKRLLEEGAKQLPSRDSSRRPIHQAAQNGHLPCVKLLLKHSPTEIDKTETNGFTALTLASQKNQPAHLSVMRYLVNRGAKVM